MPLSRLNQPAYSGRYPSLVSQLIYVDPQRGKLDTSVYQAVFTSLEQAVAWAAEYPVTGRDPGAGSNAWTIELAPGVHEFAAGLVVPDGVVISGHSSAGRYAQGSDVILRCDATEGDLLSLGVGGKLRNVRLEVRGADGSLGNAITGAISAVVIPDASADAANALENVTIAAEVNGVGNNAFPIILVDHRSTADNAVFGMSSCRLTQNTIGGLTPHADSRLLKALEFRGYGGAGGVLEDVWFENPGDSTALSVAVEFAGPIVSTLRRCVWYNWPAGKYAIRQSGSTPVIVLQGCSVPADAGFDKQAGVLVNDDHGTAPWEATDPGILGTIRFERDGTDLYVYAHDGTDWLRTAALPLATWVRP